MVNGDETKLEEREELPEPKELVQRQIQDQSREDVLRELERFKAKAEAERDYNKKLDKTKSVKTTKEKPKKTQFGLFKQTIGLGIKNKSSLGKRDQIKVLRLRNMLEKKKLQNEIEKLKLRRKVELLRKGGKLALMPPSSFIRTPQRFFATEEVNRDIDSMYADTGHGDNLFGSESFFLENDYYDENYFGNEFDNDPLFHLGIKPHRNLSPLLW